MSGKKKNKEISIHKGILNYLTKEWETPKEEYDSDQLNIYEGNSKASEFPIISLTYIPFGLVMQRNYNTHKSWKSLIENYELSY